jgi:hypothetical protein
MRSYRTFGVQYDILIALQIVDLGVLQVCKRIGLRYASGVIYRTSIVDNVTRTE